MHGSTLALRPRQRTSTSCTECRRRKQKCNQAKDRPCNNCVRRYPPVECTYERSSSRSSAIEKVIDLQHGSGSQDEEQPSSSHPPSYQTSNIGYASQATPSGTAVVGSGDQPVSGTSHPFYAPLNSTTNYWQQQDDPWSSQNLTSSGSSTTVDTGYYQSDDGYGYGSYSAAEQSYGGYYSSTEVPVGSWLSTAGDPGAFVGTGTSYDILNDLPIDVSRRNAELFHFFHQSLAPFIVTIDGKDPPATFYKEWTPWIVQSPLMSNITILSSSCYQSEVRGLEVAKCPETIAIQGKIISLINDHLKKNNLKDVGYEAIAAVMYLALNEWYWGDDASFWAHMKGLKEMLRLQGGIESMPPDSILRKQIILTDYQVACSFERDIFLLKDSLSEPSTEAPNFHQTYLESPLLQSEIRFIDICSTLDVSDAAAEILDDMKFLSSSILSLQAINPTPQELLKFQATVLWTHNRISTLPEISGAAGLLYETLRLTALIYSSAILSRSPLSISSSPAQVQELGKKMWQVSISRWKKIPCILLWIVLVACACPNEENQLQKKFLKMMIGTVAMHIGVDNYEVAVACMRGFLAVQRWLEGAEEVEEVVVVEEVDRKGKGKLVASRSRSRGRTGRGSIAGRSSREELVFEERSAAYDKE